MNGYGITRWPTGAIYYGQNNEDLWEGYGLYKFANKNEYDGQWKNGE